MRGKGALFRGLCIAGLCVFLTLPTAAQTFSDVPESLWSYGNIEEAAADGAIRGYANGTFEPEAPLSLAHFTVMMSRSFYTQDYNNELSWIDPNSGVYIEWYTPAEWVAREHVRLDLFDRAGDLDDILLLQTVSVRQKRALLVQFDFKPQGRSREDDEQIHEYVQCFIHMSIFLYVT